MTRFWLWLRRLFVPWLLTILVVFVSPATFAYDCQTQARADYDYSHTRDLRYDTAAVLAANENLNQLTGGRVFFATFPKFLAAKTVATPYGPTVFHRALGTMVKGRVPLPVTHRRGTRRA